ncbi:MAG: hypothetical protein HY804_06215 [Nitrospinae bacterium]|nr:hypothetical protein [Nitrospinota bacterium]
MNDKDIIERFAHDTLGYDGDITYPDKSNSKTRDIDAVADSYAIEHTSIDSFENQRGGSDWFGKVIDGLEKNLGPSLSFRLKIVFPINGVQKGLKRAVLRGALSEWIENESTRLVDGKHDCEIPGIPFPLTVIKQSDRPRGLFFGRFDPEDTSLSDRLKKHIASKEKAKKLIPYKEKGKTTILLIESADGALMDNSSMLTAMLTAFDNRLPDGVDQVWFVDTSIENKLLFTDFTKDLGGINGDDS